jgi:DNA-binding CsgD family transcriptional regulator
VARRAIAGLAMMLEVQGEEEAALGFAREAVDLSVAAGDRMTEALAWMLVGRLTAPDRDQARAAFRAATEAARVAGVATLRWQVLGEFANLEWGLGQRDAAVAMAQEAVAAGRAIGNPDLIVIPASVLARDAMFAGRPDADTLWLECLQASRELGDPILVNLCLTFMALRASWRGDLAEAADDLAEAARLLRHVGSPWPRIYLAEAVGLVLLRAGRPLEGLRLIAWKELAMGPDWFDSPPWMDYVRTEVDRVVAEVGDPAAKARGAAQSLSFEEAMGQAEHEIDLLLTAANKTPVRDLGRLSHREAEIARLTSAGLTNREIGRRLSISERTAEAHVQHILNKLALANRAQIAAWVVAHGFAPEVPA